jgi:hypothetical protein
MRPTFDLLGKLAEQNRSLVQVELSLVRAELRERGVEISSSLTKVGVSLLFLPIGVTLIFVAISLATLWDSCGPRFSNCCWAAIAVGCGQGSRRRAELALRFQQPNRR